MLAELLSQWFSHPLPARQGPLRLRIRWRLGVWGLVMGLGAAPACTSRREHECTQVQAQVLEEIRVVDGFHDHQIAENISWYRRRLHTISAELHALNIQDAALRLAVERYLVSLDDLAGAYSRVADSQLRAGADGGLDAGVEVNGRVSLGALLSPYVTAVNDARSAISAACGKR